MVRFGEVLGKRLVEETTDGSVLEETSNEDVVITSELFSEVEGASVRLDKLVVIMEDVINLVLFTEGTVNELEINAVVSFGDTAMLELFLAMAVESDKLEVTDEETLAVAVLVINVEVREGVRKDDDMINVVLFVEDTSVELSIDSVTFFDNTIVELFRANVSVNNMEDGEIPSETFLDNKIVELFSDNVLVINVEFSDGGNRDDDMINVVLFIEDTSGELSTDSVTFLDNTIVELFSASVSVNNIEDGEIPKVELLMLTMLDDRISVLLST